MTVRRAISSLLLLGRLLARAHCWAPPALFRPQCLSLTTSTATTSTSSTTGSAFSTTKSRQRTCKTLSSSISSVDDSTTTTTFANSTAESGAAQTETIVIADDDVFTKPDRDPRQYRWIRLPNQLQVLLVSDQLAPGGVGVEAGSVHVQAGHFDDTIAGLSHFNEHLLFLGKLNWGKKNTMKQQICFIGAKSRYPYAVIRLSLFLSTVYYLVFLCMCKCISSFRHGQIPARGRIRDLLGTQRRL